VQPPRNIRLHPRGCGWQDAEGRRKNDPGLAAYVVAFPAQVSPPAPAEGEHRPREAMGDDWAP
jgi:hypothetical protein